MTGGQFLALCLGVFWPGSRNGGAPPNSSSMESGVIWSSEGAHSDSIFWFVGILEVKLSLGGEAGFFSLFEAGTNSL